MTMSFDGMARLLEKIRRAGHAAVLPEYFRREASDYILSPPGMSIAAPRRISWGIAQNVGGWRRKSLS
jgi:hypothetical protein